MKNVLIILFLSLSIISCSKNDDSNNNEPETISIVGTWQFESQGVVNKQGNEVIIELGECDAKTVHTFSANGSTKALYYSGENCPLFQDLRGGWVINGDRINIDYETENGESTNIDLNIVLFNIDGNSMRWYTTQEQDFFINLVKI